MQIKTMSHLCVPEERDVIHVYPDFTRWPGLLAENRVRLDGLPDRREARRELWRTAAAFSKTVERVGFDEPPDNIVVTGHQAIWHHCGVWVKNVVARKLADKVNGQVIHLVLDHDVKDTSMLLPRRNPDGCWEFETARLEDVPDPRPLELRVVPRKHRMEAFREQVFEAIRGHLPMSIWEECTERWSMGADGYRNVAELIAGIQAWLNRALGLDMLYLPVSHLSATNAFLRFVLAIMSDAERFYDSYNRGVRECLCADPRSEAIVVRPLDRKGDHIEIPFWAGMAEQGRENVFVRRSGETRADIFAEGRPIGAIDAGSEGARVEQLRAILAEARVCLRPKAVTLTLFARLYLADWFIHGVGGAVYERITDSLLSEYYRVASTDFGVATSTIRLPFSDAHLCEGSIADAKYRIHNIPHSPEKYMDLAWRGMEPYRSMIGEKRRLTTVASDRGISRQERRDAWNLLKARNRALFEAVREKYDAMKADIRRLEGARKSQVVHMCREYFFGLFPRAILDRVATEENGYGKGHCAKSNDNRYSSGRCGDYDGRDDREDDREQVGRGSD